MTINYKNLGLNDSEKEWILRVRSIITPPPIENEEEPIILPPDDEIWYTTTDGNVLWPKMGDGEEVDYSSVFGANISSNTYENGQGIIKFDGPVTMIGDNAYHEDDGYGVLPGEGNYRLLSMALPNSVLSIGESAFKYCENLTTITIPDTTASIGRFAFTGCFSLTSIKLPNSLTVIERGVFNGCISLTSVKIPNTVTSIEQRAFYNCWSLVSVSIPNSVTLLDSQVFNGCIGLTSLRIGSGISKLTEQDDYRELESCPIFMGCINLRSITVDPNNTVYNSRNKCNAIIETATNKLILGCKTTFIPNNVVAIAPFAFYYCMGLKSITIPSSVTAIYPYAFNTCFYLNNITPAPVNSIDLSLGYPNFSGLIPLTFDGITNYEGFSPGVAINSNRVGMTVRQILERVFYTRNYLINNVSQEVINSSLQYINENYMVRLRLYKEGQYNLMIKSPFNELVYIDFDPSTATNFEFTYNNIKYSGDVVLDCLGYNEWNDYYVFIPKNAYLTNYSGNSEFNDDEDFFEFVKDNFVWLVNKTAIDNDTLLDENRYWDRNVYTIGFPDGNGGYTLTPPVSINNVTARGVTISPESISANIFKYKINFFNDLMDRAVYEERRNITKLMKGDFTAFRYLDSVILPTTSAQNDILNNIQNYLLPPSDEIWYTSSNGNIVNPNAVAFDNGITVVSNTYENGKGIIKLSGSTNTIGQTAFANCSNLTSIKLPSNVTSIGISVFEGCTGLTSIIIPSSVTSIGNSAFEGCTGLTSIIVPSDVTSIGDSAFEGCTSLTSVIIPSDVTSIGGSAFSGCTGLTSISCAATTPPTLGEDVFSNTNNVPIYVPDTSVDTYKAASGWSTYADRIQVIMEYEGF